MDCLLTCTKKENKKYICRHRLISCYNKASRAKHKATGFVNEGQENYIPTEEDKELLFKNYNKM